MVLIVVSSIIEIFIQFCCIFVQSTTDGTPFLYSSFMVYDIGITCRFPQSSDSDNAK